MKGHKRLTIVIKLGTSSIVHEKTHEPLLSILSLIVETVVQLVKDGHKVAIVSSGAVGMGLRRMRVDKRPKSLTMRQALAGVGQCQLMGLWDTLFGHLQQPIAQILLTRNDIADRTQYLNAQNTFSELFNMGVIPIVNENDTLAVSEIRAIEKFGDNDTLSAITAAMVQADYLFLMTDVDCLYDKNPRSNPDARAIEVVHDISELDADVSSAGSSLGTGGMATKLVAARLATSAGVTTIIARSSNPRNIRDIIHHLREDAIAISARNSGEPTRAESSTDISKLTLQSNTISKAGGDSAPPLHTRFLPNLHPIRDRSFWLLHGLAPHGTIFIDEGAYRALKAKAGLLPAGVLRVEGNFAQQEAVRLVVVVVENQDPATSNTGASATSPSSAEQNGDKIHREVEVGRALVNYSATEIGIVKGKKSTEIRALLGYADSEYIAYRENISIKTVDKK